MAKVGRNGEILPFDDAYSKPAIWAFANATFITGSDTSNFDMYRQGVELLLPKHYFQGAAKMHSGEENHETKQNIFGQLENNGEIANLFHEENDNLDPASYIVYDKINNAKSTSFDNIDYRGVLNNGILEPLTIRDKFTVYSLEAPYFTHDIKASFEDGNSNFYKATDRIVSVFSPDEEKLELNYIDCVDMSFGNTSPAGYISTDFAHVGPVEDNKLPCIKITTNMDATMIAALTAMSPHEDSLVTSDQIAMTSGFVYDFGRFATDSIAFGGMAASQIQIAQEVKN